MAEALTSPEKRARRLVLSVRDCSTGRVVDHMRAVVVHDPRLVVQRAGYERVRREGRKNVHAFVRGSIVPPDVWGAVGWRLDRTEMVRVSYNPYKSHGPTWTLATENPELAWPVSGGVNIALCTTSAGRPRVYVDAAILAAGGVE